MHHPLSSDLDNDQQWTGIVDTVVYVPIVPPRQLWQWSTLNKNGRVNAVNRVNCVWHNCEPPKWTQWSRVNKNGWVNAVNREERGRGTDGPGVRHHAAPDLTIALFHSAVVDCAVGYCTIAPCSSLVDCAVDYCTLQFHYWTVLFIICLCTLCTLQLMLLLLYYCTLTSAPCNFTMEQKILHKTAHCAMHCNVDR